MTLPFTRHLERWQYAIDTILKIATATMSREIFLAFGNAGLFNRCRRCKTARGIFLRDLSTLPHNSIFIFCVITVLTTARDDELDSESAVFKIGMQQ